MLLQFPVVRAILDYESSALLTQRSVMTDYLIIGAGAIGTAVAQQLAAEEHRVTIVSRRGTGPQSPGVTRESVDATRADRMTELARGKAAIFNCANPPYHRWVRDWPPIANALLTAAERSGAVLVTMSNLYAYGRPSGPMTPDTPFLADYEKAKVRARMWLDALDAHHAGRLRASEVRASDFIGPDSQSLSQRALPRLLAGKSCQALGSADMVHSWTYTLDAARTLITCAQESAAWGGAWHVPTNAPRTQREVINDLADAAGVARVRVSVIPPAVLWTVGLFNPSVRELRHTNYQMTAPFIIDDATTRQILHLEPTPWPDVLTGTLGSHRPQLIEH